MITIDRIEVLQREFDTKLSQLPKLSFEEISDKFFNKILRDELKFDPPTWPFWIYTGSGVCLYYECLWKYFTEIAYVDPKAKQLREELLVMLMIYRPFMYYILSVQKSYSELEEFNNQITSILDEKRINTSEAIRLREILKLNNPITGDLSNLAYFHYFINFEFEPSLVGIDRETLKMNRNGKGLIIASAVYGDIYNGIDTYIYRNASDRLGKLLLTPESISKFAPITKVESLKRSDRIWIEHKLTKEENQFAIQYSKDVFTLSSTTLNKEQAEKLISGGAILIPFSQERLKRYTSFHFYELLGRNLSSPTDKPFVYMNFGELVWGVIEPIYKAHSMSNFDFYQFILNVSKTIQEKKLLPDPELKAFSTYIGVYSGDIGKDFEIQEFLDYVKTFISLNEINEIKE